MTETMEDLARYLNSKYHQKNVHTESAHLESETTAGVDQKIRHAVVLAAVSGGPDSMAMLDMLVQALAPYGLVPAVTHVNYHKRPTAVRDQKIVEAYCQKHNLPFYLLDAPEKEGNENFQSWARNLRYDFFEAVASKLNIEDLVVAHQMDDVLETWKMQKDAGRIPEWYGLKDVRRHNHLIIHRPLLGIDKKGLEDWCRTRQIEYGIDESNLEDHYTRNKIRHEWIEKLDFSDKQKLIDEIRLDNENLQEKREQAAALLSGLTYQNRKELLSLPNAWLMLDLLVFQAIGIHLSRKHLEEIAHVLIQHNKISVPFNAQDQIQNRADMTSKENASSQNNLILYFDADGKLKSILSDQPNSLLHAGQNDKSRGSDANNIGLKVSASNLSGDRTERKTEEKSQIVIHDFADLESRMDQPFEYGGQFWKFSRQGKTIESVSVCEADFPLVIRAVKEGERIDLRYGSKKISRIYIDKKVPAFLRHKLPVLANTDGKVIFLPETGCDILHFQAQPSFYMVKCYADYTLIPEETNEPGNQSGYTENTAAGR